MTGFFWAVSIREVLDGFDTKSKHEFSYGVPQTFVFWMWYFGEIWNSLSGLKRLDSAPNLFVFET